MDNELIIECLIDGFVDVVDNKVYFDVKDFSNKKIKNLTINNFRISIDATFKKIIEFKYCPLYNKYTITPNTILKNAKYVVVSLYDKDDVSYLIKVNDLYYRGCSNSIKIY